MSATTPRRSEVSRFGGQFTAIRERIRVEPGQTDVAVRVVYAGTAAYAVLFVSAAILHYSLFETPRLDLGNMVQAIWNTQHGHFLEFTTTSGHQRDRLGSHVDPFLLLLVPFFWIWSSSLLLLALQAISVASGALPVFWLARKHLCSPRAGAAFAFAYLLYPVTQFNTFSDSGFHSVSLTVPLVLYAVWFLDNDRRLMFSFAALLAASTKEEIPLAVGCLGLWYAVRKGGRLFGLGVFAAGLGITFFNFLWVIPHFAPRGVDPFARRYQEVGGTPRGMVHTLFTDPVAFAQAVASPHKAIYLGFLLVPFFGLCLLEPLLFVGALPDLAINLLSNKPGQTSFGYQDTAGIAPFIVAASIFGAARLKRRAADLPLWVVAAAASVAVFSPLHLLTTTDVRALHSPVVSAEAHALSMIPDQVAVSASNQLGGHLSERRYIYTFPYAIRARWIVVNVNESDPTYDYPVPYKRRVRTFETDKAWQVVFSSHGIVVLHRRAGDRG